MKLLVLAGGIGSRFGATKQLIPVGLAGETLLEYNVYDALKAGFDSLVFLIRKEIESDFASQVLARLPKHVPVQLVYQDLLSKVPEPLEAALAAWLRNGSSGDNGAPRSKPWGTGHALLCAMSAFAGPASGPGKEPPEEPLAEPFAVINADDLYGPSAFAVVHDFLTSTGSLEGATKQKQQAEAPLKNQFCLATYPLDSVVPPQGSVSRAVCTVDGSGNLVRVTEHVHIERKAGHIVSIRRDGTEEALDPSAPISMNIWGLTTSIFARAKGLFGAFLSDRRNWEKGEFYLPSIVDSMLQDGSAVVKALPVVETSFGLTNPEDLSVTRSQIAALTRRGSYPSPLWSGFQHSNILREAH